MLWASAFVAIRHLGDDFSAGALSLGRLLVGAVALAAFALPRGLPAADRRQWRSIVVIGVLWYGVYMVALNEGEQRVDAGTAAMLIQVSPVLIAVLAAMFLSERFTPQLAVGLALAFGGVARDRARPPRPAATATSSASALCLLVGGRRTRSAWSCRSRWWPRCRRCTSPGWPARSARSCACRSPATLVSEVGDAPASSLLVAGLPRRLPDRDRVHDLRLRAAPHERLEPRRHDLPRAADHHRAGLGLPRRGPPDPGLRRRRAGAGRRRGGASHAARPAGAAT